MANELFDLLGIDADNPRLQQALRGAAEVEHLIDTLVAIRRRLGISQAELAEHMETTQSAVSKFERAGSDPRISTLQRYADAVNARIRLSVDATACRAPVVWRASYQLTTELDDLETDSSVGLAS